MAFTFGAEIDTAPTKLRFWLQLLSPGMPTDTVEVTLNGTTTVSRQSASISDSGFRIDTRMVDMPHSGDHPLLGHIELNIAKDQISVGAIEGSVDPVTKHPRIDAGHPASSYFDLRLEVITPFGTLVTGTMPARVVNNFVTDLFPDSPYTHADQLAVLYLFRKGMLTQPVARVAAGFHSKTPPATLGTGTGGRCCCCCEHDSPCSVKAQGHCSRFLVRDAEGYREQLLFVASHPGVASTPAQEDRVLVYKTITNEGPRAVRVYWDGNSASSYQAPGQSELLLPGNSITVCAARAVKVVFSADPPALAGDYAKGTDVVSWCCPDPWNGPATSPSD
jgi:hypothetical protein